MRRLFVAVALAFMLATAGFACAPTKPPPPGCGPDHPISAEVFQMVNDARAQVGARQLAWNCAAGQFAHDWAVHIAQGDYRHSGGPYGENIWTTHCGITAAEIHFAYMTSPAHRANLLDSRYHSGGVGVACNGATNVLGNAEEFAF